MSAEEDAVKFEILGKLNAGTKAQELAQDYGISYPKILKWKKEFKEAKENGTVADLIAADKVTIHEVAESVKHDIKELTDNPKEIEVLEGEVDQAIAEIDGLKVLNTKVQTVALRLASKIEEKTLKVEDIGDLQVLVNSLAVIQNAFFNKPLTNVNVLNAPGANNDTVSEFKKLMRD